MVLTTGSGSGLKQKITGPGHRTVEKLWEFNANLWNMFCWSIYRAENSFPNNSRCNTGTHTQIHEPIWLYNIYRINNKTTVWRYDFWYTFACIHRSLTKVTKTLHYVYPIGSMYGIFTYIWLIFMVNVGKYTKHRSYGYRNLTPWTPGFRMEKQILPTNKHATK